uniref:Erythromycin biosynthesis protein CIII-like C-terminal domain-containing protein n=1 Tax=Alexandrium monilatum TaxID=311494 RepID=A0A7S4SK95_9DINO
MGEEQTWRVVGGGGGKGGIVVRAGKALASAELPERLSKGSLLRQRDLCGERLHFERVTGSGPTEGWVSTKAAGREIVVRGGCVPLDQVDFGRPIPKLPSVVGTEVWLVADPGRNTVQSYAALALGLLKAGYGVRLFAPRSSEVLVRSLGVPYTPTGLLPPDFQQRLIETGRADGVGDMGLWAREFMRSTAQALRTAVEASPRKPDVLCHSVGTMPLAVAVFLEYGIPGFLCPTRVPAEAWDQGFHGLLRGMCDVVEEVVGPCPFREVGFDVFWTLTLTPRQIIGAHIMELGALEDQEGGEVHREIMAKLRANFCGYWFLPAEAQIRIEHPAAFGGPDVLGALSGFLQSGPAVYVGWGSKACGDYAGQLAAVAVGALKALGLRGIVAAGGAGGPSADALAAALFPVDAEGLARYAEAGVLFLPHGAPHEWLFPRCACVVHHGGPGTTAAALRGSVPMVVMPSDGDHYSCSAWVEKMGVGVGVASGLWSATSEELARAIAQATSPAVKAKAAEVGKGLRLDFGVRNAVMGMNMYVQGEVRSGKSKKEWEKMKEQAAKDEAFHKELEEEPEDGVLRPPPALLAAGPDAASGTAASPPIRAGAKTPKTPAPKPKAPPPPPSWLRPDTKGKIMTMCFPLKGHVIHFKRIATWFREVAPLYEVHMVLMYDDPDIPAGVIKHVVDSRQGGGGKSMEVLNSVFAAAAGLESMDKAGDAMKALGDEADMFDDFVKIFVKVFMSVRPQVLILEQGLSGLVAEGFVPALCKTYEAMLAFIIPMCIKEDQKRSFLRVQKTLERHQRQVELQAWELHEVLKSAGGVAAEEQPEPRPQQEEEAAPASPGLPSEEGAEGAGSRDAGAESRKEGASEQAHWLLEYVSSDVLNHIRWKAGPEVLGRPQLQLMPSPGFFHAGDPEPGEVYCMPFLPLPSPAASGAFQHGRADLEGSIGPELLDWLFSEESADPIVYVAFGTIVSTFSSRALIERLVEALADSPWRVLMVLPEDARGLLPQEGDTNFWRWTALGAEAAKWLLEGKDQVREGDVFTEEHLSRLNRANSQFRDHAAAAELGVVFESRARAGLLQPGRFRVEGFVPQVHVLRCERVRAFVSHNGANSTLESMACGVPMLCTPFYMDQYDWAHTVRQNLRAGIQVDKIITGAEALRGAVRELLEDPAYRRNAQAVARRMAAQSELLAKTLGPGLEPKASLGPGLSVLGALCVAHVKHQDIWPNLEHVFTSP